MSLYLRTIYKTGIRAKHVILLKKVIIIILCNTQTGLHSHREACWRLEISDIETRDIMQQQRR